MKVSKALLCSVAMSVVLSVAGGASAEPQSEGAQTSVRTVSISTIVEVPPLLETKDGVIKALAARGYVEGRNFIVKYQAANGNMATQQDIAKRFAGEGLDVIVAVARVLVFPAGRRIISPLLVNIAPLGSGALNNLPHDFDARLPHLNIVADARVMTALAINLRMPQDEPATPGEISASVYHAASTAFYDLAEYDSLGATLCSVAKHAAPSIALA